MFADSLLGKFLDAARPPRLDYPQLLWTASTDDGDLAFAAADPPHRLAFSETAGRTGNAGSAAGLPASAANATCHNSGAEQHDQSRADRSVQDAQEEAGNQQNDIAQRILQKMAPMIVQYAKDNGFGMVVDTTKPWPQSPVLWYDGDKVDITKPIIDAYNAQSGVPAPAAGSTTPKPAGVKPVTPKPAAPTTPKSN
jgi:hypothetical protein